MHYYKFNIGDYRAATTHLTPLEHYIYRSLIDWYYLNEKPFESVEQVARLLMLSSDDEIKAIKGVLSEFFNLHKGKYFHKRIRQEVKNFKAGKYVWDENNAGNGGNEKPKKSLESNGQANEKITESNGQNNDKKALSNSERQARYKERKRMLKALFDKGVCVDNNADFWQVCQVYIENFPPTDNQTVTDSDNESNETKNEKNGARTINQEPITINQESERATVTQNHTDTAPVPAHTRTHNFQNQSNVKNQSTVNNTQSSNQKFGNKPVSLPDDFKFTKEHLQKCQSLGFDIEKLFEHFKNHCRSKNKQSHDWDSEFMIWINREQSFVRPVASPQPASWQNQNSATDPYAGLSYAEVLEKDKGEDMVVRMTAEEKEASDKAAAEFFANFRTKYKPAQKPL